MAEENRSEAAGGTEVTPEGKKKNTWIVILAVILGIAIIALLATIVYKGILSKKGPDAAATEAAATSIAAVTVTADKTTGGNKATSTPTSVVVEQETPTKVKPKASATPAKKAATATPKATDTPEVQIVNVIENGGFEWGFGEDGVAAPWQKFTNGGAKTIFMPEPWPLAIRDGDQAQRITIYEAHLPDRYAGIYQRLAVEAGQSYRLTLYGQIRSGAGDVNISQYGYKMQYAIDWQGGVDWQAIPDDEWVELPWDEQLLDSADVEFLKFSAKVTPPTNRMTLFIRAWNKWPDPVEAQYTLDTLSLVGPKPQKALVDEGLPASGGVIEKTLPTDPVFWGSLLFLIFLLGGAIKKGSEERRTKSEE